MGSRARLLLGFGAVLLTMVLVTAAFADSPGDDQLVVVPVAATPEAAVAQVLQANGVVYAGACVDTRSPEDIGKACSKFVAERGNLRAYLAGRTFSEFDQWIFVQQDSGGWHASGTAALDASATSLTVPWP